MDINQHSCRSSVVELALESPLYPYPVCQFQDYFSPELSLSLYPSGLFFFKAEFMLFRFFKMYYFISLICNFLKEKVFLYGCIESYTIILLYNPHRKKMIYFTIYLIIITFVLLLVSVTILKI